MTEHDDDETMEKINDLILDISKGSTFSSAAMAQFVELQSEVSSQESTIRYLRKEREGDKDKIGDLASKITMLEGVLGERDHEITGWRAREDVLEARETVCLECELRAEYSNLRVEDHQNMVGLIFRNTELRKKFVGQEMHYQPGTIEIKDEYGNIKQYAEAAGFVGVPVEKVETESKE